MLLFLQNFKAGLYLTFNPKPNVCPWESELADLENSRPQGYCSLRFTVVDLQGSVSNLSHQLWTKSQPGFTECCVADHLFSERCFWPPAPFPKGEKSVTVNGYLPLLLFSLLAKLYWPTGIVNLAFNHLLDDLQKYFEKWKLGYKLWLLSPYVMLVIYYRMEQAVCWKFSLEIAPGFSVLCLNFSFIIIDSLENFSFIIEKTFLSL